MNRARSIPVTLLTGFLGSGKTTLLNRLIKQPAMTGTLVIVNEFGAIALDHWLLVHSSETAVLETSGGCVCCTVRQDLARTLRGLPYRFAREGRRQFDRVLIETTGLANPAPILYTLANDPRLRSLYHVAGTVTTVDAVNGAATLASNRESVAQVAAADRLLITKSDLATEDVLEALRTCLWSINPGIRPIDVCHGDIRAESVIDLGDRPAGEQHATRSRWFDFEAYETAASSQRSREVMAGPRLGFGVRTAPLAPEHRIDPGIRTDCRIVDAPLPAEAVAAWIDLLTDLAGPKLLRMKAIVQIDGQPGPVVLHAVQHVVHPPDVLPHWPSADRRSRIVLITRDLDPDIVATLLAVLPDAPPPR